MSNLTETQQAFLDEATRILDERESSPKYQCWRIDCTDDEGTSYCRDCLKPEIGPAVEYWGGGYSGGESDGSEVCACCGCLLDYTLTDEGVSYELDHYFETIGWFDWNDADQCYELARIAHGIYENPDQERMLINILLKGKNLPAELKRIRTPKCYQEVQS